MDATALLAKYRLLSKDNAEPLSCSDSEIMAYLNEAEQEACKRARLIFDKSTEDVCQIAVEADTETYSTHSTLLEVQTAYITEDSGNEVYISQKDRVWLDSHVMNWRSSKGQPRYFILDDGFIQLVPTPEEDCTLNLEVYRLPIADIVAEDADNSIEATSPEVAGRHHLKLLDWVFKCAYLKPDQDNFDPVLAVRHEAIFDKYFGKPVDYAQRKRTHENLPQVNKIW
jgi:hypothetical protein